ncbi:MAG: cysteine hydrolase family protein [Acidimicrobiales bacterium]|nr:cysteine hydrolase family protein [Acidimicrobiales bacterium]
MPIDLAELVRPEHTAVVTCEMQRGIIGDEGVFTQLVDEVRDLGIVPLTQRLVQGARAVGVRVVHATVEFRADRAGTAINNPMMGAMTKLPGHILQGTDAARVVSELGPEPVDLVVPRLHGLSPFTGTALDATLRNLGVHTIVAVGVSVNEAVFGMCLEAANLGYRVALPTDAVAGHPRHYAEDVIRYSLSLMTNLTTVDDVLGAWGRGS